MPLTPHDAPMGEMAIAVDPFAPDTLYAEAFTLQAIAKSTNGGKNWSILPARARLFSKIVAGPDASQHVTALSADTPDYSVHRSADGGMTWQRHHFTPAVLGPLWDLAVDPHDWNTMYTAHWRNCFGSCIPDSGGVAKSVDGGSHWFAILEGVDVDQVLIDPFTGTIYAINAVSYRSDNGGATWTSLALPGGHIFRAALDPVVPHVVYVSTESGEFWRSDDAGRSWHQLSSPFGWNPAWTIAVNPADRAMIAVGSGNNDLGAARSVDGGQTWVAIRNGLVIPEYPMQLAWIKVMFASNGRLYGAAGFLGAMTLEKTPDGRRRAVHQ